jgi:hypothetical protein
MTAAFLSEEWLAELRALAAPIETIAELCLNLKVTGGPEGDRELHLAGLDFGPGLVAEATTTVVLPYDTARRLLLEEDTDLQQAALQAVMAGEVQVQGDINKLMGLAGPLGASGLSTEDQQTILRILRGRLREITAD